MCAPASSRGRSRAARETGKRDQIAPSFGFCEREKGRGGRREGPKKSVHEIASDRGLVGKRRNQREPWSARLRDRRGDDVERQQHGAWGRKKGQRRRGSSHTLHRPPPPSSGPSSTPHSQLLHPPPSSSQQEAVDVGVFSWPPLTLFCGRRSWSNLTIGTGTSKRNHHVHQPAPGEPPRRCCLPDSEYGFDGALSLRLFLFWASKFSAPTSSVRVQVAAARLPCPPARFGSVLLSQASGGNGETRPGAWWPWPRPGPGESTWDVHRCPAHCTACDAGGPSEAGRRHEQRDFCVDLTPASPVSKAPTWGRVGPVLLTVLIDRIQLALRLTSLETI